MAVPIAAKIALMIAKDKEARKTVENIIFAVVFAFFLLIVLVTAVIEFITSPSLWFEGEDYNYLAAQIEDEYTGNEPIEQVHNVKWLGDLLMPCNKSPINSDYGMRIHPIDKVEKKHTGMDFGTQWHDNIFAVADGVVTSVKTDNIYGQSITIEHYLEDTEQTIYSFYAHLSSIYVSNGDTVAAREVIALEGGQPGEDENIGKSTAHHLHFEIRVDNANGAFNQDPKKYLGGFK